MFSSRTDWNLTPNALTQLLEEKRKRGERILDLTESNPTACGFRYPPELAQSLASEQSLLYEPDPRGLLSARNSVAEFYDRKGIHVDPGNIFLTASTSEAYSYLFRLLCNPGETVLVPRPSYPLFDYLCRLNDVEPIHYRLSYDNEWYLDGESLRNGFDQSTRALLLVHPNNPTGSFLKNREAEQVVEISLQHNIALIVDEVFGEYQIDPGEEIYGSFAGEQRGLVFTLSGISKLMGLPQMKLSWIVLSGDAALVHDARNRLDVISDTYLSVGTPIQQALSTLFRGGQEISAQIRARITANHAWLRASTSQGPISLLKAEGGWNAILRLPNIYSDEAWALRMLQECNILVHPGHFFEIEQDTCIVVSLLPEETSFSDGITRGTSLVRTLLDV